MVNAAIGKAQIAALIPHTGAMCLLGSVVSWDRTSIICRSTHLRAADHPLASGGRLDTACGIEYAAQAMALHGGLNAGRRPEAGYLASIRDVTAHAGQLDAAGDELEVTATLLAGDTAGAVYRFALTCGGVMILEGRAAVVIDAGAGGKAVSPA